MAGLTPGLPSPWSVQCQEARSPPFQGHHEPLIPRGPCYLASQEKLRPSPAAVMPWLLLHAHACLLGFFHWLFFLFPALTVVFPELPPLIMGTLLKPFPVLWFQLPQHQCLSSLSAALLTQRSNWLLAHSPRCLAGTSKSVYSKLNLFTHLNKSTLPFILIIFIKDLDACVSLGFLGGCKE